MKTLLILLAFSLASCTKQEELAGPADGAPIVKSITWSPAYAGSNMSIMFKVTISLPAPVSRLSLIRGKDDVILDYENNPESGTITMYDHMADAMPLFIHQAWYLLEFKMADGTTIRGEKFQVY